MRYLFFPAYTVCMTRAFQSLADALHTSPGIAAVLCIVAVALVGGVAVRGVQTFMGRADATRWGSMAVWWGLGLALVLCVVVGWPLVWVFAALVSALGLSEFARVGERRGVASWVTLYFLWALHYVLVLFASRGDTWSAAWAWALPAAALVLLCGRRIVLDRFEGFVGRVGRDLLGVLLTVYALGFAAVVALPGDGEAGAVGWGMEGFIFLLVLTFAADVAAAWWGKALGRRKVLPTVSPNKTWAGVVGSVATAVVLGALLWPLLELSQQALSLPAQVGLGAAAGLLIGVGAFFGDAVFSAFKREHGLDTLGRLFPGQGGVLDRWDSLTLTAPLWFGYLVMFN